MSSKIRLSIALGVVALSGLLVATLASGSGALPNASLSSTPHGASATRASDSADSGVSNSAIVCPAIEAPSGAFGCGPAPVGWCCPGGSMPGVTVTGQATLKGAGAKIRDQAIREAVVDARDQAEVAAKAAGVKLGQVLSMQISSSGYPYPLEASGGGSSVGGQPGANAPACSTGESCPRPVVLPAQTFVSVTMTWAIG
jgi:hypothetical protein